MPALRTGDIDTYYEESGRGPPLVLIHPATMDHTAWEIQRQALAETFRVIVYDVRGHGKTPIGPVRRYDASMLGDDLHHFIGGLGLERPFVCGLSLGAMVAQVHASRYPNEVRALILAGAQFAPMGSFGERVQRAWLPRVVTGMARVFGYEMLRKRLVAAQKKIYGKKATGAFEAHHLPPMPTKNFIAAVRCFASFHRLRPDLAAIRAPTLILHGANEPAFIVRHAPKLGAAIADSRIQSIPDAGHASNLDQPVAFTEALLSFFLGNAKRAPGEREEKPVPL